MMKLFTVVGYFVESGQTVCHHVMAKNGIHAFCVLAQDEPLLMMVVAMPGHLTEGAGDLVFPGGGVVDAATILEQPEVFGPGKEEESPKDVPDPLVQVHPLGKPGEWEEWHISQNLTDRWGDINYHNAEKKPLGLLKEDDGLLERLRAQMWDEITFITRKDGQFGILFEVEMGSLESEKDAKDGDPKWYASLRPHAEVVKSLLDKMQSLEAAYPGVQFAVPHESQIPNDRPAAWAFVPDGLLSAGQREALGHAMLAF